MIAGRQAVPRRGSRGVPLRRAIPRAAAAAVGAFVRVRLLVTILVVGLLALACGPSGALPGTSDGAPGSPGAGSPAGSGATPRPTPWPGDTVNAVVALGAADNEIGKASADFDRGVKTEDLRLMRTAADGLSKVDVLLPNVDSLEIFDYTKPLAAGYRIAIPKIVAGATQVRDSIDAGDASGIEAGSQTLAAGLSAYAEIRPQLSTLVEEAIELQRLLLN